jgi:ADP-ribose pyrophosphatase YjhB (NUDIX family)
MRILNVFDPDLIRGSEHLAYDPEKAYAYVEHPVEGWRVYLRSAIFIHEAHRPFQEDHFLVFRNAKKGHKNNTWEPPKGQMEGKDFSRKSNVPLLQLLAKSALRETHEEGHLDPKAFLHLRHTGLVFQSQEQDYPKNHFFQYHLFQGFMKMDDIQKSFDKFDRFRRFPKEFARQSRDKKETDAVAWFNPKMTPLNPRWCPAIIFNYLREMERYAK